MKESLLQYLACPRCRGALVLQARDREGSEVMQGDLTCGGCGRAFPVERGVPRFAALPPGDVKAATARRFGAQWTTFSDIASHHEAQLRDWIAPVGPDFVKGKVVLEAGCGKGRHTRVLAGWGARDVVAVDLSAAVDVAFDHVRELPNAHVIQGDILQLPLRPVFDYVLSVGVLHHLPEPPKGFASIVGCARPGGAVTAWVYGREGNGWIVGLVDPVRRRVTSRLPQRLLYALALPPAIALWIATRLVYRPAQRIGLGARLFYGPYLLYVSRFPLRELHTIVFDHLTAPVAHYVRRDEFAAWFTSARCGRELAEVAIAPHNANSWRGFAVVS